MDTCKTNNDVDLVLIREWTDLTVCKIDETKSVTSTLLRQFLVHVALPGWSISLKPIQLLFVAISYMILLIIIAYN